MVLEQLMDWKSSVCAYTEKVEVFFFLINKTQNHKPKFVFLWKIAPRHLLDGFVPCVTNTIFWLNYNQIESTITKGPTTEHSQTFRKEKVVCFPPSTHGVHSQLFWVNQWQILGFKVWSSSPNPKPHLRTIREYLLFWTQAR